MINYIKNFLSLENDTVSFPWGVAQRARHCGSIGSLFEKAVYNLANIRGASYRAPNISDKKNKSYCKSATMSVYDCFKIFLFESGKSKSVDDQRVIINADFEFEVIGEITETREEMLQLMITAAIEGYEDQLASGEIKYNNTDCGRKSNPIQNIKKGVRDYALKSYGYNVKFDCKSCVGTLMSQLANKEYNPYTIDDIAIQTGISRSMVKLAVNSSFFGGRANPWSDAFASIEYTERAAMLFILNSNDKYTDLIGDIKEIRNITGLAKDSSVYFKQERKVIECIEEYIRDRSGRVFTVHDGGYCDINLNRSDLEEYVYNNTGFKIIIEVE